LAVLGWVDGRNLQVDIRWGAAEPERAHSLAAELLSRAPDLVVVTSTTPLEAVLQQSHSVSVLALALGDNITDYVQSIARPGGNITGFTNSEAKTAPKWLEFLKQIAPGTTRAIILGLGQARAVPLMQHAIEEAAPSLGVRVTGIEAHNMGDIERAIDAFAREPNGGLISLTGPIVSYRDSIISQAARNHLPAVYPYRFYAEGGGLLSYGVNAVDIYRRGAVYAGRILLGEKPGSLPIQAPTKFELVINLKTAEALGLTIPETLLAADEVIQ
jgi:putative ABC transport system substrate-binding protein